jgi:hypothetical protein
MTTIGRRTFLGAALAGGLSGCRRQAPVAPDVESAPEPVPGKRVGKFALLVGVTTYLPEWKMLDPPLKDLEGPGNDVALLGDVLKRTFHFPDENIVALTEADGDRRPTRANIQREFKRLTTKVREGDHVVILLSGHGSQQPEPDPPSATDPEPDGLDEIFLPADARVPARGQQSVPNAIIDDELGLWTKRITDKGAHLFLLADCCHAGTITRGQQTDTDRGVPFSQLFPRAVQEEVRQRLARRPGAQRGHAVKPSTFNLVQRDALAALYACQPDERAKESWFPHLGAPGAKKYGIMTFAVCEILSQSASPLTYRELVQRIPDQYQLWGRDQSPTPFAEGGDLDREVVGEKRWPGRSALLVSTTNAPWTINGGKLHGLSAGSILAVRPPAGAPDADRVLGHVCVKKAETFSAEVIGCAHGGLPAPTTLPEGGRLAPVYLVHDLKKIRLAIGKVSDADRAWLTKSLRTLAGRKSSFIEVVSPASAAWRIEAERDNLVLAPAGPGGAPRFVLQRDDPEGLPELLGKIARARNLLAVAAGEARREVGSVALDVEIRKMRDKTDMVGTPISRGGRQARVPQLRVGDYVRYFMTNKGRRPVDVTLLVVDGELNIVSMFPHPRRNTDNRIPPDGKPHPTQLLQIGPTTVPREHLIVIAVEANGPQVNFNCLAENNWESARSAAVRGGLDTPLGKLFEHALFRVGDVRGSAPGGAHRMLLLSWDTLPAE